MCFPSVESLVRFQIQFMKHGAVCLRIITMWQYTDLDKFSQEWLATVIDSQIVSRQLNSETVRTSERQSPVCQNEWNTGYTDNRSIGSINAGHHYICNLLDLCHRKRKSKTSSPPPPSYWTTGTRKWQKMNPSDRTPVSSRGQVIQK